MESRLRDALGEAWTALDRADQVIIRQFITSAEVLSRGWTEPTVTRLLGWTKSTNQFLSFIDNLHYSHWEILLQTFPDSGGDLPVKINKAWVTYQSVHTNMKVVDSFNGYKCSGGTEWRASGQDDQNWSGCYIATSRSQAEGYAGEAGAADGTASLWEVTLKKPMLVCKCEGGFIDEGSISGDFKAAILKKIFNIDVPSALIPTLGAQKLAYMGPAGEDGVELVVPWAILDEYIQYKRVVEYTVNKAFEVTKKTNL